MLTPQKLCEVTEILASFIVVIILQGHFVFNHYLAHLKCIEYYMSIKLEKAPKVILSHFIPSSQRKDHVSMEPFFMSHNPLWVSTGRVREMCSWKKPPCQTMSGHPM